MRGIVKRFAGVPALDEVDFELRRGEIHALLGENGAGKSTLMRVLAGLYAPDAGSIEVDGRPVRFRSAADASAAGIGMVHQHFTLVENFTVAENLALALPGQTPGILPRRGLADRALQAAKLLGWHLDPDAPVWQLPVGVQQRVEIVKVLATDPGILIFDEPTAVLAPVELEEFFAVLRRLRDEGRAIVFISHKLPEVMALCDRVTVLRHGRNAGSVEARDTDPADLARRMVGAEAAGLERGTPAEPAAGQPVLEVRALSVPGGRGLDAVRELSLDVRPGEVLGIAGVDGNGQAELAEAVVGLRDPSGGSVRIAGEEPVAARRHVGFIPQDRLREGLVRELSVRDNLVLELQGETRARRGPWLRWDVLNTRAREMRERYDVRAASLDLPAGSLSGGNQQKIVIARALSREPRLLVAVNPTRGLDVGAAGYVYDQLRAQRAQGAAVLLISTDLDEVLRLSDRVGVLYQGRLMGIVPPETERETLGLMMGGLTGPSAVSDGAGS